MDWDILARLPQDVLRRHGRFVAADLTAPHRVISTSATNGGQTEHLRHLLNHQSCEGAGHDARFHAIHAETEDAYHDRVSAEAGLPPSLTASMGTAANMNYTALATQRDGDVEVLAAITAGVHTNATCAGDPAAWRESASGMVALRPGTINIILLINTPVTASALARIVAVATEGKSAALKQLAVPSCASQELATGTGTDQYCVAAPLEGAQPLTSASPHVKLGEMVGASVRDATVEALRWQNGLEPSYTRGLFHALGRYGVTEARAQEKLETLLSPADLTLLAKNSKSVFFEPLAGAAAHAFATVLDRARHGTLPPSCLHEALLHQAATLAVSLAGKPERWPDFRARLQAAPHDTQGDDLIWAAIALGWSEKWKTD